MRFKLLAGKHVQADKSQKPAVAKDVSGNVTKRYPSKVYHKGDIVESDDDLVKLLGRDKFQLLGAKSKAKGKGQEPEEDEDLEAGGTEPEEPADKKAQANAKPAKAGAADEATEEADETPDDDEEVAEEEEEEEAPLDEESLKRMSVSQLRRLAVENDIDLGDATKKADMIEAILATGD